jgi:hypothetical protein
MIEFKTKVELPPFAKSETKATERSNLASFHYIAPFPLKLFIHTLADYQMLMLERKVEPFFLQRIYDRINLCGFKGKWSYLKWD